MLKLESIEYKNLNSVGNTPIKLDLNRWTTTLVGGKNGTGKSTAVMAIAYNLYGKFINGMKLEQAINSQNKKNLLTTSQFEQMGDTYSVIRGEKPKRFEIFKNGEKIDKNVKSGDYQAYLDTILGMDYKTFIQLVCINKVKYKPFFEMGAADRRKLVEDVLNISIFSYMNEEVKSDMSDLDKQIRNLTRERDLLKEKQNGVSNLVKQMETVLAQSVTNLEKEIDVLEQDKTNHLSEIEKLETSIDDSVGKSLALTKQKMNESIRLGESLTKDLKRIESEIKFYESNDVCPTCKQDITNDIKNHKCDELGSSKVELDTEFAVVLTACDNLSQEIDDLSAKEATIQSYRTKIHQLKLELKVIESSIEEKKVKIRKVGESDHQKTLDDSITQYEELDKKLESMSKELNELYDLNELYSMMKDLLKDDGVKTNIIRDYNGILNRTLNEYLNAMGFYINITLDENFKESFHSMNKESFSYENLSTGQATRLNIAFMLCLLELGSIKNSTSCNLLWLDETLENLDDEGVEDAVRLLKTKLTGKNIFVATQRYDEFVSKFQSSLQFKLNEGFTEIVK